MILVTGANGQLGRAVVEQLLKLLPASRIGVSVRDPERSADIADRGVSVRHGDFQNPAGLADAFAGAEKVLLISTDIIGAERVALHRNAVEAAKQAHVQHILYTSIVNPDPASPFPVSADHEATEAIIRASGLRWTFLRNTLYMELLPMLVGAALAGGDVDGPADGPIAYATRADLAEGAANLLARGGHVNEALNLTGSTAIDLAGAAQVLSQLLGRTVGRNVLSDSEYQESMAAAGVPAGGIAVFQSIFAASREGRFAEASPSLGELLGREPTAAADLLRATLEVGVAR